MVKGKIYFQVLPFLIFLFISSNLNAAILKSPSKIEVNSQLRLRLVPPRGCDLSGILINWDFGDGERMSGRGLVSVTHRYKRPGRYVITVKATGERGGRCRVEETTSVEVKELICRGYIRTYPGIISAGREVKVKLFSPECTVYKASFDFGDGEKAENTKPEVTHIYEKPGNYTIIAQGEGRNPGGKCRIEAVRKSIIVRKKEKVYSGRILFTPQLPLVGQDVAFKLASFLEPIPGSFNWGFGDGVKEIGKDSVIFHKFEKPGNYKISVYGKAKLPTGEVCKLEGIPLYITIFSEKKPKKIVEEEKEGLKLQDLYLLNKRGEILPYFHNVYLAGDAQEVKIKGKVVSLFKEAVDLILTIRDKDSKEVYYSEPFTLPSSGSKDFEQEVELDKPSKTLEIEVVKLSYFPTALPGKITPKQSLLLTKTLTVMRKEKTAPPYFIIGGFIFWIDSFSELSSGEIEGSAHTIIPFKFLKTETSSPALISPQNQPQISSSQVSQYTSPGKEFVAKYKDIIQSTSGSSISDIEPQGELIYVDLKKIGYKNFVLDGKNNITNGSFMVKIESFLDVPETKLLYLKDILFTPQAATATFTLNLGENFDNKTLIFEAKLIPSFTLYSGILKLKQNVEIKRPFSKDIFLKLEADATNLNFQNGNISSSQIRGEIKLENFSSSTYRITSGYFVFEKDKVGMLLDEVKNHFSIPGKEMDLPIEKSIFTEFIEIFVPKGNSSFSGSMGLIKGEVKKVYLYTFSADKVVADFADFARFDFDQDKPSWVGAAVFGPRIKLPVQLITVEVNKIVFKADKKVDITEDVQLSGKFYKDGEQILTLLNPKGFKVKVKNGSYLYLKNNLITYPSSWMAVDLIFPDYLQAGGKEVSINLDGLLKPDLKIQQKISYGKTITLKEKPSLGFDNLKMEINIGEGLSNEIKFKEGKVYYMPYYPGVFALLNESFKIDSTGIWGEVENENLDLQTKFQGFPVGINKFEVKLTANDINKLKVSGWIKFDSLGGIKRPFLGNFKWDENKIQILSAPLTDEGSDSLSKVYDGYFFEIDVKGGNLEQFLKAKLNVDFKIKIFGLEKTYNIYNFQTSPTKIAEVLFTIGDNWDFFGLKALLPKGKVYVKGDKIVLEVKPKFTLGEGWLSFPMQTEVKFKSDGGIESTEAGGNINIDLPQVKFKGKVKFNYDEKEGIKFTGGGKLKLLDSGVGVEGDFLYGHEFKKDYDYFKIFVMAEGFQIPLGIGMSFYGLGGGFAYNMKIDVNPLKFKVDFKPQKNNLGFIAAVNLGTDDQGYTFYSKGTLNISISTSGSAGEIGISADAWVFEKKHEGKPPLKASLEFGWGNSTELLIAVGMKYEKKGIIKLPKGGGYNTGIIHATSSGVEVKLGEKSKPWSAKLFNLLDGSAYFTLDVKSNHIGGTLGGKVSFKAETSTKICAWILGCCKLYAGVSGKSGFDIILDFYPNFFFDYTGEISANAYAGCCVGKLSVGGSIIAHISAPEPADFTITLKVPYDIWIDSGTIKFSLDIV